MFSPKQSSESINKIVVKSGIILTLIGVITFFVLFYSFKFQIEAKQKDEVFTAIQLITEAVESSKQSALAIERIMDLRMYAISKALADYFSGRTAQTVTREELVELKEQWDVHDISIFVRQGEDIVVYESSDPNEVGLGSIKWGYWHMAFQQLLALQLVDVEPGYALPHYYAGPLSKSELYEEPFKYAYYYDGSTDFIINAYIKASELNKFIETSGPSHLIKNILNSSLHIKEIAVINIKPFLNKDGQAIIEPNKDLPVLFGNHYTELKEDRAIMESALHHSVNTSSSFMNAGQSYKKFYISFANDRLLTIVIDESDMKAAVDQFLLFMILIFCAAAVSMYFFARKVNKKSLHMLEHIKWLAYYDPLTRLANRNHFMEYLAELISGMNRNETHAIFIIDLDNFKNVNDTLGHSAGDQFLIHVAKRITQQIGDRGFLARMGGDEFTLVLSAVTRIEVNDFAQRLLECMKESFTIESHDFILSMSIGISMYPEDGKDAGTLLKHADMALYWEKNKDKNNVSFFQPAMKMEAIRKLEIQEQMRISLEEGRFVLYYQPQIDLRTDRVIGLEALIRWNHPTQGLTSPSEFISVAEETGLIIPLGEWVLQEAARQYMQLREAGMPPLRISVNLSARQFKQNDLLERILAIIDKSGLSPHLLTLEITESTSMTDMNYTIDVLSRLRDQGVRIAIDDFGTAYSVLSYLNHLPIHYLKIDRSFIHNMDSDKRAEAVVRSILDIAEHLGLQVVAEGVESQEHLRFLKQHDCDEAQGYYFSPPIPYDKVLYFVKSRIQ